MRRILCGPRAIHEALAAAPRSIHLILYDERSKSGEEILRAGTSKGVLARPAPRAELDTLGGSLRHQGVIAITGDYPYLDLDGLLRRVAATPQTPLLLALDTVQDVHNVGSLIRSAVALGAQGLILCRHGAARVSPTAVRVSAGASEHAAIARVTNLARSLGELKDHGMMVVGLDADGSSTLDEVDLCDPIALVLGSEGSGMRRLVRRTCDIVARLPMTGPLGSLNVAVSGALALYETNRQRRKKHDLLA